jgi:hypothetical protein
MRPESLSDKTADQHHVYRPATAGIAEVYRCSTCGEQRAIIGAERIGPINPPTPASTAPRQAESVTSLRHQLKAAEATLQDLRAAGDGRADTPRYPIELTAGAWIGGDEMPPFPPGRQAPARTWAGPRATLGRRA